MNNFTYSYPTKVYFGQDAVKKAFDEELPKAGKTVMLAYGGGSIKKNGIYDAMITLLKCSCYIEKHNKTRQGQPAPPLFRTAEGR